VLPNRLSKLKTPQMIDREKYEAEQEKTKGAMEINRELSSKLREAEAYARQLEQLKSKDEVETLRAQRLPEPERYEDLRKAVASQLNRLSGIEVRCLLADFRHEPWQPSSDTYLLYKTVFEDALASDWITEDERMGSGGYTVNSNHPRYSTVRRAIVELGEFIEDGLDPELKLRMEEENGYRISTKNRQYWDEALFTKSSLPD
jgi:hypothetical protein